MNTSKKVLICIVAIVLVSGIVSEGIAADKMPKLRLRLQSHTIPDDTKRVLVKFHEIIRDLSGDQIKVKAFPVNAIVPMKEVLEAVGNGTLDMALTADGYWHSLIPVTNISSGLPFAFRTIEEAKYFMFRKGLLELVREAYAKHNVYYLPYEPYNVGIMTKKPINKGEDLNGLKMRAFGLMAEWLNEMGASTTYIPGGELYTALATGVVDGAHWGDAGPMYIMKFQEVLKNYMLPEPVIGAWNVILVNMDRWKKMNPQQRAIIESAVMGGGLFYGLNDMRYRTASSLVKMQKDWNVSVNALSEAEIAKMQKAAIKVWEKAASADERSAKAMKMLYDFLGELGYK
jgi:TRAP-type mannitol/chloroaromatic compound transport system substrate-binding protein